ncbi:MAG: hypothetical protein AB1725_01430 [Armatimonadota bacterium]
MKGSDFASDRPLGVILAVGSGLALLLTLLTLALLAMAGEEGRQELTRESDRLVALGASRRLVSHLDLFLWTLAGVGVLGVLKGIGLYRGTRRSFQFAIGVNLLAVLAFVPWVSFENPIRGVLSLASLLVLSGALIAYCALRLAGRIGPRPG